MKSKKITHLGKILDGFIFMQNAENKQKIKKERQLQNDKKRATPPE